jgi:hypothetical protein
MAVYHEKLGDCAQLMKKLLLLFIVLTTAACAKYIPEVKITKDPRVQSCEYINTISEITDPGHLWQHLRPHDPQYAVLKQADHLGATHLVWVYDFWIGSAGIAYRCDP